MATTTDEDTSCNTDEGHPPRSSLMSRGNGQRPLCGIPVVMFQEEPEVREIQEPFISEQQERWYTSAEYFFIKKDAMNLVRRMSSTRIEDSNTVSTRGLEIVDDERVRARRKAIETAVKAVLKQQDELGKNADPEQIAAVYRQVSLDHVRKSIDTADDDAKEAEKYLKDTRKSINGGGKKRGKLKPKVKLLTRLLGWKRQPVANRA